jgi:hypothetical protein
MSESSTAQAAKNSLHELGVAVTWMENQLKGQQVLIDSQKRRLEDAEARATLYEQRADENKNKAERTDMLEEACEKLLVALDRLPTEMKDAGIIPVVALSDIALYGTYDWQAVMDAKFALKEAMKRGS